MKVAQDESMLHRLQTWAAQAWPEPAGARVTRLVSITSGWENEMYAFDLEPAVGESREPVKLVLRVYPGQNAAARASHEFRGMALLRQAGYPVPQVHHLAVDSPFDRPFVIMERAAGQELLGQILGAVGARQAQLLDLFCQLFVRLHLLDWRPFASLESNAGSLDWSPFQFIDEWLETAYAACTAASLPDFLPVLGWLEARRGQIRCPQPAVLHGDFHPGNILALPDGAAAVIDWTGWCVSDPRFDLGWTLLLARAHLGIGWRDHLLHTYERFSGAQAKQIAYFEVCAGVRRLLDAAVSLQAGPQARGMRPGAEDLMRAQAGAYSVVTRFLVETTGAVAPAIPGLLE